MRLFDTGRLSGLKNKLICRFKLAADVVGDGIWEFYLFTGFSLLEPCLQTSDRCQTLPFFLIFLSFHFSRFSFYIIIIPD